MPTGVYVRSEKQKEDMAERFRQQAMLRIGKKREFSDTWKSNMSKARKGMEPWNKGKKGIYSQEYIEKIRIGASNQERSEETRRKSSETHKKRVSEGNCHLWRGGVYPINKALRKSIEYKFWREAVYTRDNFTCVLCGCKKSGNLEADHIMPFSMYPDLRFEVSNGRTLCKECHRKTDTYGFKQNKGKK